MNTVLTSAINYILDFEVEILFLCFHKVSFHK